MTAKDLTQEQREWFVANFDHTKNQELADRLGTSIRTVTRMARELGLWKTKEFVAAMQRNASEHGARATRLMGGNVGAANLLKYGKATRFKPGTRQKDRMSAEAYEAMLVKRGAARRELFRKELLRLNLRRHGYEIARASNEATVTNKTRRSIKIEARAERMGIKFNFNSLAL